VPEAFVLFYLPLSEEVLLQFHLFQALILDLEPAMGDPGGSALVFHHFFLLGGGLGEF
jgi:hypothetical protein